MNNMEEEFEKLKEQYKTLELRLVRLRNGIGSALANLDTYSEKAKENKENKILTKTKEILNNVILQDDSDVFFSSPTTSQESITKFEETYRNNINVVDDMRDTLFENYVDELSTTPTEKSIPSIFSPFTKVNVADEKSNNARIYEYAIFMNKIEKHIKTDKNLVTEINDYIKEQEEIERNAENEILTKDYTSEVQNENNDESKNRSTQMQVRETDDDLEEYMNTAILYNNEEKKNINETGKKANNKTSNTGKYEEAFDSANVMQDLINKDENIEQQMKDIDRIIDEQLKF